MADLWERRIGTRFTSHDGSKAAERESTADSGEERFAHTWVHGYLFEVLEADGLEPSTQRRYGLVRPGGVLPRAIR